MSNRTLHIVLIVSLILNVFVIGGGVGAAVMWKRVETQRPLAGIGRPARLRQAAEALSPEHRRALRQAIRAAAQSLKPQAEQARAARREAGRLLVQPELDRDALDAALGRARAADIAIRTRLEKAVVEVASRLPADQRIALAEGLDRSGTLRRAREAQPQPSRR
jgi:uncharacterized membrane protein